MNSLDTVQPGSLQKILEQKLVHLTLICQILGKFDSYILNHPVLSDKEKEDKENKRKEES